MKKTMELAQKLALMEERKHLCESMLNDVSDYYTKEVMISLFIDTTMYNRKYSEGMKLEMNKVFMIGVLSQYADVLDREIEVIISEIVGERK